GRHRLGALRRAVAARALAPADAAPARLADRDDLPGPDVLAEPRAPGRRGDRAGAALARAGRRPGRATARGRAHGPRRDPRAAAPLPQLPARVQRRHAPADPDRDGARRAPTAAAGGRADDGA